MIGELGNSQSHNATNIPNVDWDNVPVPSGATVMWNGSFIGSYTANFTIQGNTAHIDAMVIKFDHDYVAANDALKGHSIALFTKIYGDDQSPAEAAMIDTPGKIPDIYRGADPVVSEFELNLWNDFWKLYEDENYRKSKGVRALGGHGLWGPFQPDKLYTITLESDGGLNMTSEPLKGIYRAAMNGETTRAVKR